MVDLIKKQNMLNGQTANKKKKEKKIKDFLTLQLQRSWKEKNIMLFLQSLLKRKLMSLMGKKVSNFGSCKNFKKIFVNGEYTVLSGMK
ncbi:MAG: hypothetical protein ABIH37_03870 [archaeon]